MKLVIRHTDYGCDSGCCGHMVETEDGDPRKFNFEFSHAGGPSTEDKVLFAMGLVGGVNLEDVDFEASDIRDHGEC